MNTNFTKSRIKSIIAEEHDTMTREKETGHVSEEFSLSGMKDAAEEKAKEAAYEYAKQQAKKKAKEKADNLKKKALGIFGIGDDDDDDDDDDEASKGVRVAISKKKGDDDDDEDEGTTGVGSFTPSSGAGGSSIGFTTPFDSKGNIRPEFMKFEGSKIDDMIREVMNKLMIEKKKKNLEKKKMREEKLEEIVRLILKEGYPKKSYKRDGDKDKSELDEAELGDPNTNCTPGQPGQTCADAFNMGAISEDEDENRPPESALRKIAGSDDIHQFLLLRDENKGNAGSWVVKKVGDRVELRPTVDFAEALSKWFIKNERDPDWTIEFREESEADPISEGGGLGGHLNKKLVAKEFQKAIKTALRGLEDEEVIQIFSDWMAQDDDVPTLTREALRNMLQEEFENIMSEDDEEGIVTGLEDAKPLLALEKWLQKQSYDDLVAWQEPLLDIDGKERVKIGDVFRGREDLGMLAQHTVESGLIAYALHNAMS